MTLKEWWDFNKNVILESIFIIRVYNNEDSINTKKLLDSHMYIENAINLFGDYTIVKIGIYFNNIWISLCQPNVKDESE